MFKEEDLANKKRWEHGKRERDTEICKKFLPSLWKASGEKKKKQSIESIGMVFKAHRAKGSLHSQQTKIKD